MIESEDFCQKLTITPIDSSLSDEEKKALSEQLTDFFFHHTLISSSCFIALEKPFTNLFYFGSDRESADRVFDTLASFSLQCGKDFFADYYYAEDYLAGRTFIEFGEASFHSEVIIKGKRKVGDLKNPDFNKSYIHALKDYLVERNNKALLDEIDSHDIHSIGYWEGFSEQELKDKGFIPTEKIKSLLLQNAKKLILEN